MLQTKTKSDFLTLILLTVITALLLFVPLLRLKSIIGAYWRNVPISYVDDSLYYYAQVADVVRGNLQVGNPYFLEHASEMPVYFPVAVWLSAIPNKLGLNLVQGTLVNLFFWSEFFTWSLYFLIKALSASKRAAFFGSLATFFVSFGFVIRPVFLQVIFPFYVLYLLFFLDCVLHPHSRKNVILLGIIAATTFYLYSYLFMVVLTTLGLWLGYLILQRRAREMKGWLVGLAVMLVLIGPGVFYLFREASLPYFWESLGRIWLVATHLPTLQAFSNLAWVIAAILLSSKTPRLSRYVIFCGVALIVSSFSNVITGKEAETAVHISRFITVYFVVVMVSLIILSNKRLAVILILVMTFLLKDNFWQTFRLLVLKQENVYLSNQEYAAPITWLQQNISKPAVIWADSEAGEYIPVLSKHYTLFNGSGGLFLLPSHEVEERYLISHYFSNLTISNIKNDYRVYGGTGNAIHQVAFYNYRVRICHLLQLPRLNFDCGSIESAVDYKGEDYFQNLYQKYQDVIKPNIIEFLKKYQVSYALTDRTEGETFRPEDLPNSRRVYRDSRFEIFKLDW